VVAEAESATELPEPEDAVPQFAARWPDLPGSVSLGAREPAAASSAYAEEHAAEDEMPLVWPVITETEPAGQRQSGPMSGGRATLLIGALALILAGAVFKLTVARSSGRSQHGDPRAATPPRPLRSGRPEFTGAAGDPTRAVRESVAAARRDRAREIEAMLQRL